MLRFPSPSSSVKPSMNIPGPFPDGHRTIRDVSLDWSPVW